MRPIIITIITFFFLSPANVSGQVRLSVSGFSTTTNYTDFTNASVVINAPIAEVNETVSLLFYDGRFIDDRNLVMSSRDFNLQTGTTRINLSEFLDNAKIPSAKRSSQYITIAIVNANTQISKGFATISALQGNTSKEKSGLNKILGLDGTVSVSSRMSNGSLDTLNLHSLNSIEIHTEANLGGVPLYIDAMGTDYSDPFNSGLNPSYISFNFMADKWKETQKQKITGLVDQQANKIFPIDRLGNLRAGKFDHLDKVFKNESFLKDFEELKNNYGSLSDSLSNLGDVTNLLQANEAKIKELIKGRFLNDERVSTIKDSLENVYSSIERLRKYQDMSSLKDSLMTFKAQADDKIKLVSDYKQSIYSKPKEINKRLRETEAATTMTALLNYVDIFKVGIINPRFSKYSLATSQNKGAHVAIDFGYLSVESFYAKSISRGRDLNQDSNPISQDFIGNKISIQYNELVSNSFFFISKLDDYNVNDNAVNSQIGYSAEYNREDKKLKFETVWSQADNNNSVGENNLVNLFSNSATDVTYFQTGEQFNYKWRTNVSFLGENFSDFNNPFSLTITLL